MSTEEHRAARNGSEVSRNRGIGETTNTEAEVKRVRKKTLKKVKKVLDKRERMC